MSVYISLDHYYGELTYPYRVYHVYFTILLIQLVQFILLDPDWIIVLFFIYLDAFRVEEVGGINLYGHFSGRSSLENWGMKPYKAILRH